MPGLPPPTTCRANFRGSNFTIGVDKLPDSYDYEALWIKAKLFINRAMDGDGYRSFDEQSLWASLALELLAKAALARVSPLLIAEPTDDGKHLLVASGLSTAEGQFISVRAKALFSRCHRAFKPFSSAEAADIVNARNEYLHGAGPGFTAIPQAAWWPKFWAQVAILVTALDKDIIELVGLEREQVVNGFLDQNKKNIEHRTEALIERAKQRLAQYLQGTLPAKIAAQWKPGLDRSVGMSHRDIENCPACGSAGLLEGDEVLNVEVEYEQYDEDEYGVVVTLTIAADYFSCTQCQLVLDSFELVEQAGLRTEFFAEGDADDIQESQYQNE
jgi:hypothetical protein